MLARSHNPPDRRRPFFGVAPGENAEQRRRGSRDALGPGREPGASELSSSGFESDLNRLLRSELPKAIDNRAARAVEAAAAKLKAALAKEAAERAERAERSLRIKLEERLARASNSALERIVTTADEQLDRLTRAVRAQTDASLSKAIRRADKRLEDVIEGHLAEVDKRSRKRVRRHLQEEADELVGERLGELSERRLREAEQSVELALSKRSEEFTQKFGARAERDLVEQIERAHAEAEKKLRASIEALQRSFVDQLQRNIDEVQSSADSKLQAQADRLTREAQRLHQEAEDRVRDQAVKRLRRHTAELEATVSAARRRTSESSPGSVKPSFGDERTEPGQS